MAQQLAGSGTELILVARDEPRLRDLAESLPVSCEVLIADLADRMQLRRVEERIESSARPVDLVVNNAGLGFSGKFSELDRDDATFVVDVNVVALQRLTQAAASAMSERGGGTILNVGSLAGEAVGASSATYNATKAFVTSLGQSLAAELVGTGVSITTLLPGLTRTEFQDRSGTDTSQVPSVLWQTADDVAEAGLAAAARGDIEVVPAKRYRTFRAVNRVLPKVARRALSRRMMDRS